MHHIFEKNKRVVSQNKSKRDAAEVLRPPTGQKRKQITKVISVN